MHRCGPGQGLLIDGELGAGRSVEREVVLDQSAAPAAELFPADRVEQQGSQLRGQVLRSLCAAGADRVPSCVTAEYAVKMRKPTPTAAALRLEARVVDSAGDRATVEATIAADGVVTATCRGTFVAVRPGHPAYHRW